MKLIFTFGLILASTLVSMAQTPPMDEGNVILHQTENAQIKGDARIEEMEKRFEKINQKNETIDGYRIQLFSSSGADSWNRANAVQTEFLKIYPDIPSYVIHIKPSFRVRIGDYRTRMEAERFYVEIRENFPDAFIVRDKINMPELSLEAEQEGNPEGQ